ncbi:sensor histidine kinase N-terminal domain-containing protein [Roseibium alexandrii]|uniref:sensor histidine kinase N-terminal domain-containing protein n=1 Tax=Roseibium alexandrii TaxID=388408 RepID=UPI003752E4B7
MKRSYSLRLRLTLIILLPLLLVAGLAGVWQLNNARSTASDVFDRSLQSAALAVTNDVALSGGDALVANTRKILSDTSGGRVYYHVYAPDGVIVAGYATPPVGIPTSADGDLSPVYFNGEYLGREVRGYRMRTRMQVDGFSGVFTTTVWQDVSIRAAFVQDLTLRSLSVISSIILSLALIVWFGIRIGLWPLSDLQQAIDLRSGEDLKPIRRPVPVEVQGIVQTLNRLLGQVTEVMATQNEFISNAAHQLRNPIAGVLALAEAVRSAKSEDAMRERAEDLVNAVKDTSLLAQKLLTYERAKAIDQTSLKEAFSVNKLLDPLVSEFRNRFPPDVEIIWTPAPEDVRITGDRTMIREAVSNLIDNAFRHGGPELDTITVGFERLGPDLSITIADNGVGLTPDQIRTARMRFGQVSENSGGSGLGLPIVERVAERHGGWLELKDQNPGLVVRMIISVGTCAAASQPADFTPTQLSAAHPE